MSPAARELQQVPGFPAGASAHYLNHAASAPLLEGVAQAMKIAIDELGQPLSASMERQMAKIEGIRRQLAGLIGASSEEIAFTSSTSHGLSLIAQAIRWRQNDRVLYPAHDFPSNRVVWQNLEADGVKAEALGLEDERPFEELLCEHNLRGVRAVSVSATDYRNGRLVDFAPIRKVCREQGILLIVDGIQTVGNTELSVKEIGCDFLACGSQKWLFGPVGTGFVYVARERLEEISVPSLGWTSLHSAGDFSAQKLRFISGARRFEAGLPNLVSMAGLEAALSILEQFGWKEIFDKTAAHNQQLRFGLLELGFEVQGGEDSSRHPAMVALQFQSREEARTIAKLAGHEAVQFTQRGAAVRLAAHAFTRNDSITAALDFFRRYRPASIPRPRMVVREHSLGIVKAAQEKRALITGATGALGEALARELLLRGYHLVLLGRDLHKLQLLADELSSQESGRVQLAAVDLSALQELERWIDSKRELLNVDLLINNAAHAEARLFSDASAAELESAFAVNTFAPMKLTQAALPFMLRRNSAQVVNVVTTGARNALPLFSLYSASKGALWSWSEALTRELGGTTVRVLTYVPPHMESETRLRLGRVALGYYGAGNSKSAAADPNIVARELIRAVEKRASFSAPLRSRLELLLNSLAPWFTARRLFVRSCRQSEYFKKVQY